MIYCVEDDKSIRELMIYTLNTTGFEGREFSCATDFWTDIERIGDHCSNLGIAIRIGSGEMSDKHGILSKMELEKSHDFEKYYDEYLRQFSS